MKKLVAIGLLVAVILPLIAPADARTTCWRTNRSTHQHYNICGR